MSDVAIRVDGMGKRYRIGARQPQVPALSQLLPKVVASPFQYLRTSLRKPSEEETLWALRDVSFEVKQGDVMGIIGRNGAGKSTLLKILSRITEPTEGSAGIRGRVASLLEVGTGFHPELTGRENVYLNGAILGMKRLEIRRKFDEIVAFSELERFIDTPVKRYSSGMYVRLAFAVAAHLDPEVLLVDEVLAVGDYQFQQKSLGKMGEVSSQGRTVLLVSHNLTSIASLCKSCLLLDHGGIVMRGEPAQVIEHYISSVRREGAEVVWEDPMTAPGNDKLRLHAVRIKSADGAMKSDFDIREEVVIEFAYWNLQEGISPHVSMDLHDQMGTYVLNSANIPTENATVDEWFGLPFPKGLFRSECRIPAYLLNRKSYAVSVAIGAVMGRRADVAENNILSFQVHDYVGSEYWSRWPGAVHPRLAWTTRNSDAPVPANLAPTGGLSVSR